MQLIVLASNTGTLHDCWTVDFFEVAFGTIRGEDYNDDVLSCNVGRT